VAVEQRRAIVGDGLIALGPLPVSRIATEPATWLFVASASGLLAWALLSAAVLGGLLVSTRVARGSARQWTQGLHEFIGALAVVFTVIHIASVPADPQLGIGLRQLLIPFTRAGNPLAQGCGVLAAYLLTAVMLTSWARTLLPWRWWRQVHHLSFPLWALASMHTVLASTPTTRPTVRWASLALTATVLILLRIRLLPTPTTPATVTHPPTTTSPPAPPDPPVTPTTPDTGMQLLIDQTTWEADNVLSLRLHSPTNTPLPPWQPGAHIELALPSGRRRQYSLYGDPTDTQHYHIAVLRNPTGRGGSTEVHTDTRAGQLITIHGPRNHFPLQPANAYLLIAGGIGITAIMAMATHLATTTECDWKLIYTGRRRTSMAFLTQLPTLGPQHIQIHPTDERPKPDLAALITAATPGTAIYCCGPDRLLHAVHTLVTTRPDLTLHSERFTGTTPTHGTAFHVELHRSGLTIPIPPNRTILHTIRDLAPHIPTGCEQGICGNCRTTVLSGEPDHRDHLLTPTERTNGTMLICVSRARTPQLTLDL
jgi:ferredoxin-NADP reductase/DMSO/TMAO reductase YedYZ heme-binding membrane subunit